MSLDFLDDVAALELQAAGEDVDAIVATLPIQNARSILEVGCGSGAFTRALARVASSPVGDQSRRVRVVGMDRSPASVAQAVRLARAEGLGNVEFVAADILDPASLAPLVGQFDIVICRYFLMYMTPGGLGEACLANMRTCARRDGLVACVEVDANFGEDRYPPPSERLDVVLRRIVPLYRERGLVDWRCGITLHHHLTTAGLRDVRVRVVDGRCIAGGSPRALVQHGSMHVEELLAPCLAELGLADRTAEVAAEWRAYLASPEGFVYTPVFLGVGRSV
ncbi:class I SAM-dependent methyltransferase [Micromonospora sp. NPDC051296]|uniref:class I SAM-dependent methyltransferase n=1 Tax=Micromonospora sp. NPDC051296 TaxID=3155046 RepID=UPI003433D3B5